MSQYNTHTYGVHINRFCSVISRKFQSLFVAQDQNRCERHLVLEKGVQEITQYLPFTMFKKKPNVWGILLMIHAILLKLINLVDQSIITNSLV